MNQIRLGTNSSHDGGVSWPESIDLLSWELMD